MPGEWTPARVRAELPDVPVRVSRRRYLARVTGRRNPQATVTLSYVTHGAPRHHLRGRPWMDWHFAWDTLAHALNTDTPLSLE